MMRRLVLVMVLIGGVAGAAIAGPAPDPAFDPASPAEPIAPAESDEAVRASVAAGAVSPAVSAADVKSWDDEVADVDKLRTPDAPAFVILGASPTEIQHPTTPRDVAITLAGLVKSGDLAIPDNVAIEVAPYWLLRHPDLTIGEYRREWWLRPLRTLSFSIGTAQSQRTDTSNPDMPVQHTDAEIGLGVRTMVFQSESDDKCTQAARKAVAKAEEVKKDERVEIDHARSLGDDPWRAKVDEIQQRIANRVEAVNRDLKNQRNGPCLGLVASARGWSLDLAGALDAHVSDAKLTWAGTSVASYAVWSNLAYDTTHVSGIAVARFMDHRDAMTGGKLFDAGLRGLYKQDTFGFSAEALIRRRLGDAAGTTYRLDFGVEHKLTGDTWLSVTFGKGFAILPGEAGSWFALSNLQWSFGKPSF